MAEYYDSPFRKSSLIAGLLREVVRCVRIMRLRVLLRGKFSATKETYVARSIDIRSPDYFKSGVRVSIGKNFTAECNVIIGDDVLISSNVSFIGNDHRFDDPGKTVFTQGRFPPEEILLEGDNLIGFGSIIIAPCRVGRGAIIAAGAVVKGDVPSNSIYGGVPGKYIKDRF